MQTIGQAIERRAALPAGAPCDAALAMFAREPSCRFLAVVDGARPVGLVGRAAFMARMQAPGAGGRAIIEAMEPEPLVADAAEPPIAFLNRVLAERPDALRQGFIVTEDGAYAGVADLVDLAPALLAGAGEASLVERVCAEVRQPVAHALAAAEALSRMRLPEDAGAHLWTIGDAARAALALLDTAADLQRAAAGRLVIAPEPRRLQELVDQIEARWRGRAEESGATLLVSYAGQPDCAAMIDQERLLQVFDALIGYAIARSGRGVVEASLQARPSDAGVALTGRVRDNGAASAGVRFDDPFSGDLDAAQPRDAGLQLGLMLARRTIAAMAGRMDITANAGPGATLAFEFTAPGAMTGAQAPEVRPEAGRRSAHVLVVDDNATNRMVVEALCEMFNCSTESVADGVEAVEAARAGRFDVILMDIKMPRMDGVTAARAIRQLSGPAGRAPIIALTANADPDEAAEYLAAGMCSVVEKPIKPERLMEALEAALAAGAAAPGAVAA